MLVAAVVTGKVVVEEGVKVESPVFVYEVAETCAAHQSGTKTTVFTGEGAYFVEVVEIDIIVCHPIGFAFYMVVEPTAYVATSQKVSAHLGTTKREVGHDGQHEVVVAVFGVELVKVVEVAIHAVRALHDREVGGNGNPVLEAVASLQSHFVAAEG